jgi:hypothetical protein
VLVDYESSLMDWTEYAVVVMGYLGMAGYGTCTTVERIRPRHDNLWYHRSAYC